MARYRTLCHDKLFTLLQPEAVYRQLGYEGQWVRWVSCLDFVGKGEREESWRGERDGLRTLLLRRWDFCCCEYLLLQVLHRRVREVDLECGYALGVAEPYGCHPCGEYSRCQMQL